MKFKIQQFIESKLLDAKYEFDETVNQWTGWIEGFPGVYSQGDNIELVRRELAEIMEEYIFVSLQEKRKIKGLNIKFIQNYVQTN